MRPFGPRSRRERGDSGLIEVPLPARVRAERHMADNSPSFPVRLASRPRRARPRRRCPRARIAARPLRAEIWRPLRAIWPTIRMMTRLLIAAATLLCTSPAMAEVRVIISGGFSTAYREILPEFEESTGIKVTTGSGASQGEGPLTIASQLERGEPFDVVVLSREGLENLK